MCEQQTNAPLYLLTNEDVDGLIDIYFEGFQGEQQQKEVIEKMAAMVAHQAFSEEGLSILTNAGESLLELRPHLQRYECLALSLYPVSDACGRHKTRQS